MGMGFILVILSAVLFGTMPFFAKQIYALGGNAQTLCLHRFVFSIPFLYLILRFRLNISLEITKEQAGKLGILSLGSSMAPFLLFQSYSYISSGMATTIHFVYPILVILGCWAFYHEKMTGKKALCALLCCAGILCFYSPGEKGNAAGMLLAFTSGAAYAFYVVYYAKSGLADEMNLYKLNFYLSIFSSVILTVISGLGKKLVVYPSAKVWLMAVFFAFMVSILATVFFQAGTKEIGPEKASMISTFEPLTSVLVGIFVFHERFTLRTAGGIFCILCAVVLLALPEKNRE